MLDTLFTIASAAGQPLFSNPAIEAVKSFVNYWSQPQYSLPLFVIGFVAMMMLYRKWTKPVVFWPLFALFLLVYFGSMAIDYNYLLILSKADNVPITLMLLGAILCIWVAFREAAINDERLESGRPLEGANREDKVLVWPDLVYIELICLVIASAGLILWAVLLAAPLEAPANPAGPPNPSKAPWYFLGLQEMLVYFDPWMAGVILPGLIITGLIAMPFIDTNPKGNGYYTIKQRPFALSVWLFGFLILWVVLIVFGTFLRGPNWNFFGPYEYWDSHMSVPLTNINLSDFVWIFGLEKPLPTADSYGAAAPFIREFVGIIFTGLWIFVLPVILARTLLYRLYTQMGPARFYIMAFHLVIMGMMPLKMVLRWLVNLKYFIYLPEFNLNL